MSEEVKLYTPTDKLIVSTYPMRAGKGDKEIWIDSDGDIVAVDVKEEDALAEEYTINIKKDFDALWGFIVNVTELKRRKEERERMEYE